MTAKTLQALEEVRKLLNEHCDGWALAIAVRDESGVEEVHSNFAGYPSSAVGLATHLLDHCETALFTGNLKEDHEDHDEGENWKG